MPKAVTVRLPDDIAAVVVAMAEAGDRSLSNQVVALVRQAMQSDAERVTPIHSASKRITPHQSASPASRARPEGLSGSTQREDQDPTPPLLSPDGDFEELWATYPPHHENSKPGGGGGKKVAREAYERRVKPAERPAVLLGAKHYRADRMGRKAMVKNLSTWLNQREWDDWQEPAATANGARAPNGHSFQPCESDRIEDWIPADVLARQRAAGITP